MRDIAAKESLNLTQRLSKIRSKVEVIKKAKQGYNYTYSDIVEILAKITGAMKEQQVSLQPKIVPGTAVTTPVIQEKVKFDKMGHQWTEKKTEILVQADMVFTWVCDDTLESLDIPWTVIGMQEDPSQAFGSALTYCTRYFLTNYFQVAQDNDVDKFRSIQKESEKEESRAKAEEIMDTFDTELRTYLAQHPEDKDKVKKFTGKYVKDSKYMTIKEPILASQILKDFRSTFVGEEKKEAK